jgi:NNP family nitrate/nitrite transporter-like MFS transporter
MAGTESRWIDEWNPEDERFWETRGKGIARRNLIWSIVAENLGFSIWLIWSVVATRLTKVGFHYTTDQLFDLVAVPGLVGSLMRFPYAFAVPKFGGRNWTIVSAALLFVPTILLAVLVNRPETPYWVMALAAATAGLGGGNFASSMANISFFYPDREKGFALGLNAAGGNIGVSTVQLLVPIVIGSGWIGLGLIEPHAGLYLANAGLMWMPFVALAVFGASRWMNNLTSARANVRDQLVIAGRPHTWIMSFLYLGGTSVTFWNFVAMALATVGVLTFVDARQFWGFLAMFLLLFVTTGVGNGSTYRMIPVIFRNQKLRDAEGLGPDAKAAALKAARIESATVLGFVSAIGACGGYLIPRSFGASLKATGSAHVALQGFLFFYAACIGLTWFCYMRRQMPKSSVAAVEARV